MEISFPLRIVKEVSKIIFARSSGEPDAIFASLLSSLRIWTTFLPAKLPFEEESINPANSLVKSLVKSFKLTLPKDMKNLITIY
jgi:hypothetical protein